MLEGLAATGPLTAVFSGQVYAGGFAAYVGVVILIGALLSLVQSVPYLQRIDHEFGEVYALILFATAGMLTLGKAGSLVTVFVGLETMSICLYVLTGLVRAMQALSRARSSTFCWVRSPRASCSTVSPYFTARRARCTSRSYRLA